MRAVLIVPHVYALFVLVSYLHMHVLPKHVFSNLLRMNLCKNITTQNYSIEASGIGLQVRPHQPLLL
jgi:hypothetical protein